MRISDTPIDTLRPHPRNPRRISDARLEQLKRTLSAEPELLQARPVIALPDGTVIAGNQRLRAAVELGWQKIPTVTIDLEPERAARWALLDNRPFGEDDEQLLAEILREHDAAGWDPDLAGYSSADVDAVLRATRAPNLRDPDDAPEPPAVPESKPGEVYELGPHRLMCGDATLEATYQELLAGELARMVFTDPPYGVEYTGGSKSREALQADDRGTSIYSDSLPLMVKHTTRDASFYIWYADLSIAAAAAAAAAGLRVRCQIIWLKNQAQYFNNARYHGKHEPCIYAARASGSAAWFGPKNEVTVWEANRAVANDYHPTQKPVALAERAIANSSERGDVVLDPFGGSGSTLIAAERIGRRAFLMEIDPAYCDVIRRRYQEYTSGEET